MAKINLGNFIIKKRKKRNLSSRQLALACDVTPPYMSDIESNDELRQCIRFVIKNKKETVWKKLLNEINQEGKL